VQNAEYENEVRSVRIESDNHERTQSMNNENLKHRTRQFALAVINLIETLPRDRVSDVVGRQLLRSGTSVGANYRSATRARSAADFVAKMGLVEEEADESAYWTDLLEATGRLSSTMALPIMQEAGELTAIAIASIRTARRSAAASRPDDTRRPVPRSAFRAPRSP
jgi:four helix bundle protein